MVEIWLCLVSIEYCLFVCNFEERFIKICIFFVGVKRNECLDVI